MAVGEAERGGVQAEGAAGSQEGLPTLVDGAGGVQGLLELGDGKRGLGGEMGEGKVFSRVPLAQDEGSPAAAAVRCLEGWFAKAAITWASNSSL